MPGQRPSLHNWLSSLTPISTLRQSGLKVSALSIMGLMMLAAGPGTEISISSDGREAEAGLASLVTLVNSRFDEE